MRRAPGSAQLGGSERIVMVHASEAVVSPGQTHCRTQRAEDLIDAKYIGVFIQVFEIGYMNRKLRIGRQDCGAPH